MTHLASFYQFFNVEHIQFGDIPPPWSGINHTGTNLTAGGNSSLQTSIQLSNGSAVANTSMSNLEDSKAGVGATTEGSVVQRSSEETGGDNSDVLPCDDEEYMSARRGGSGIGGGMITHPEITRCDDKRKHEAWGDRELPHPALLIMDVCCLAFFTLEYMTRFTCSPNKVNFLRALQNIVDFLAFAPDYVEIMFLLVGPGQGKEGVAVMEMLFILRILRLFRIFRLIRHVPWPVDPALHAQGELQRVDADVCLPAHRDGRVRHHSSTLPSLTASFLTSRSGSGGRWLP